MSTGFVSGLPDQTVRVEGDLDGSLAALGRLIRKKPSRAARRAAYLAQEKERDEAEAAEEWYQLQALQAAYLAAEARRDGDLPEDERLPF